MLVGARGDRGKAETSMGQIPSGEGGVKGKAEILRMLIGARADVDKATTDDGSTPAYMAAQ